MIFVNKKKPPDKNLAAFYKAIKKCYLAALIAAWAAAKRAMGTL